MKQSISLTLLINRIWTAFFIISSLNSQSVSGGDMLTETPLYPVPAEMTFEEYQDMNRRLTIGLALTSIPIPGIVHRYAGEKKKARRLFMIGVGGLGLVAAGASMMGEEEWPESDYNLMILNAGEDNEIRYEKIPINQLGDDIEYKLIPMNKQRDGPGSGLIILGALVLVGDIFYDWLHGWKMIINKRDAVRYKYGQQIEVSVKPGVNLNTQYAGINFRLFF